MSESTKNGQVLSELQQLRTIVLGEYTVEIDQRLADLEHKMRVAQVDLAKAIEDANTLSGNEIQAVRDLIEEKISNMQLDVVEQLKEINSRLKAIENSSVSKNQLGNLMIQLGEQIQGQAK